MRNISKYYPDQHSMLHALMTLPNKKMYFNRIHDSMAKKFWILRINLNTAKLTLPNVPLMPLLLLNQITNTLPITFTLHLILPHTQMPWLNPNKGLISVTTEMGMVTFILVVTSKPGQSGQLVIFIVITHGLCLQKMKYWQLEQSHQIWLVAWALRANRLLKNAVVNKEK